MTETAHVSSCQSSRSVVVRSRLNCLTSRFPFKNSSVVGVPEFKLAPLQRVAAARGRCWWSGRGLQRGVERVVGGPLRVACASSLCWSGSVVDGLQRGVERVVGGLQRVASSAWLPVSGGRVRTVGGLLRVASAERLLEVE
ncbi:hypothetical protein PHYPSEUDO_012627 [Phytophthora pseudosyringae]|uniref:Uncharacterized protein n=1 Tax=Phytophthora pseudosyringae TaxID=221518 RepID=A0A8T1V6G5_9STRA|nr:hypothetical protein PHYPSEUDO_012627 [Phytophthora pseudosyringae]